MIAADFESRDGEEPLISAAAFKVKPVMSAVGQLTASPRLPLPQYHRGQVPEQACEAQEAMRKGLKQDTVSLWQLDGALSSLRRKEIIRARFRQLVRPTLTAIVPLQWLHVLAAQQAALMRRSGCCRLLP